MKIALCFSGQPRTWKKCYSTWEDLKSKLKEVYEDAQLDTFCHAWDSNSNPHAIVSYQVEGDYQSVVGEPISKEEKLDFLNIIKPASYLFESEAINKSKQQEVWWEGNKHREYFGGCTTDWLAGQFYSVMRSAHLKRKYEMDNHITYDLCIRLRYDLYFDEHQTKYFAYSESDLKEPIYNTVHSCHTGPYILGDIFWYADSVTFDKTCDFYRWLPFFGPKTFPTKKNISSEMALYFYMKMLRIDIKPLNVDPKIYRPSNYLEMKKSVGLMEGLEGHELI